MYTVQKSLNYIVVAKIIFSVCQTALSLAYLVDYVKKNGNKGFTVTGCSVPTDTWEPS